MQSTAAGPLEGVALLIVEDEPVIALDLGDLLATLGCHDVHVAARVPDAHEVLGHLRPDAAVLDFNLSGENALEVCYRLDDLDVPFIIITGDAVEAIPKKWLHRVVTKPYHPDDVANLVVKLIEVRSEKTRAITPEA
jgi:CheY-like chemotaxis protein